MKANKAYTPVQHVFGLAADLTPWPKKSRIRKQHATAASSQGVQQHPGSSLIAASQSNHFACMLKHQFGSSNSMGRWACCQQMQKDTTFLGERGGTVTVLVWQSLIQGSVMSSLSRKLSADITILNLRCHASCQAMLLLRVRPSKLARATTAALASSKLQEAPLAKCYTHKLGNACLNLCLLKCIAKASALDIIKVCSI